MAGALKPQEPRDPLEGWPHPGESDSKGLRWGLKFCFSGKFQVLLTLPAQGPCFGNCCSKDFHLSVDSMLLRGHGEVGRLVLSVLISG